MVNAKFQKMYVFWVSTKSELTQELSEILESNAEEVRKSMEANANIGRIPKIVFIKGKTNILDWEKVMYGNLTKYLWVSCCFSVLCQVIL